MVDRARYCFRISAWNELAGVDDFYQLFYFIRNDGKTDIEIIELKHRRKFLSRMSYPQLKLEDVRPGAKIVIYSKQYKVEDYEDKYTKDTLGKTQAVAFALSTQPQNLGKVLLASEAQGIRMVAARMVALSAADAASVRGSLQPATLSPGPVVALQFIGEDAASKVRALADHIQEAAGGRAHTLLTAVDEAADGALTKGFLGGLKERLPSARELSGSFENCSCVLILPSAVAGGSASHILADLLERLESAAPPLTVSAMRTLDLARAQAEEFLEVYKQVVPEYVDMVNEYSTGPMLALEVTGQDAVLRLREMAGPRDGEVSRRIRPDCLRAKYGQSGAKMGVHVTDLVEDGPLECEYVFSILERA